MQVYEVRNPSLGIFIRYKVLAPAEAEMLMESKITLQGDQFNRLVLEAVVYNLNEVLEELKKLPKEQAAVIVTTLYNGSIMLNPSLDVDGWLALTSSKEEDLNSENTKAKPKRKANTQPVANKKISKVKFLNLETHLKHQIVGQDEAIVQIVKALKRSYVGLGDENRPNGVFLFAGASGVGKTHLATALQKYLYGEESSIIRIDCGEYQHKHENSKLIGAPPGYVGYDEGGQLTKLIDKNPHSVVLLDEVEKAHPDMWNTFLRVFDEGVITDSSGKKVSFKDSIIIMTTNLGNKEVVDDFYARNIGFKDNKAEITNKRRERFAMEAIRKQFLPELLNRIDKIVIFNHLSKIDFFKIAELELKRIDEKLSKRGFSLQFDENVLDFLSNQCIDSVENARKLSQIRRDNIESKLADKILAGRYARGTIFSLTMTVAKDDFILSAPVKKRRVTTTQ